VGHHRSRRRFLISSPHRNASAGGGAARRKKKKVEILRNEFPNRGIGFLLTSGERGVVERRFCFAAAAARGKIWSLSFGKTTMARAYYSVQEEKKSQFILTRRERKKM
jgi:hypothetical protein